MWRCNCENTAFAMCVPLLGGFYEWKKLGYPLVDTVVRESAASEVLPPMAQHSA